MHKQNITKTITLSKNSTCFLINFSQNNREEGVINNFLKLAIRRLKNGKNSDGKPVLKYRKASIRLFF